MSATVLSMLGELPMADTLTFYTNPMSRGRIIRWMLEEVGQPYDTEILGYGTSMKAEPYLKINPMGKVPAIVHKGKVVTEVAAICCYLADAFPEARLAPRPDDRADYYRWVFFTSGPVEAAFSNKAAGWEPTAATAAAILGFVRERVPPYMRIRRLEFAELPKTISGKIRRVELREREARIHGGGEAPSAEFSEESRGEP